MEPRPPDASTPTKEERSPSPLWSFCESLLREGEKRRQPGAATPYFVCEIDVGARFRTQAFPADWSEKLEGIPEVSDGDVEPIGYSFEVMIHEQYLVRRHRDGRMEYERRRRAVLAPKPIGEF